MYKQRLFCMLLLVFSAATCWAADEVKTTEGLVDEGAVFMKHLREVESSISRDCSHVQQAKNRVRQNTINANSRGVDERQRAYYESLAKHAEQAVSAMEKSGFDYNTCSGRYPLQGGVADVQWSGLLSLDLTTNDGVQINFRKGGGSNLTRSYTLGRNEMVVFLDRGNPAQVLSAQFDAFKFDPKSSTYLVSGKSITVGVNAFVQAINKIYKDCVYGAVNKDNGKRVCADTYILFYLLSTKPHVQAEVADLILEIVGSR